MASFIKGYTIILITHKKQCKGKHFKGGNIAVT